MCKMVFWFASMVLALECCGVFVVAGMMGWYAVARAAGIAGMALCALAVMLGASSSEEA